MTKTAITSQSTHFSGRQLKASQPLTSLPKSVNVEDCFHDLGLHDYATLDSALQGPALMGSGLPAWKFQHWMPGVLRVITQPTDIDLIAGRTQVGDWTTEEVIQQITEHTGTPELYGDSSNIPLANFIMSYEKRNVVIHELGFRVGELESSRQEGVGIDPSQQKREGVLFALKAVRNNIGFRGYANPDKRTFGLLNDPNLPPYQTVTTDWKSATFDQITADITSMMAEIETQSQGRFRPDAPKVLVIPVGYSNVLKTPNPSFPLVTVASWLETNYPDTRIQTATQFEGANGGANVAYLFVERESGDEDDATTASVVNMIAADSRVVGAMTYPKYYEEDHLNAVAGCLVMRPWFFARRTGI